MADDDKATDENAQWDKLTEIVDAAVGKRMDTWQTDGNSQKLSTDSKTSETDATDQKTTESSQRSERPRKVGFLEGLFKGV